MNNEPWNTPNDFDSYNNTTLQENSEPKSEIIFNTNDDYIAFIRNTIKDNTPPKAWLTLDMLTEILDKQQVPPYYKQMGYDTLESFLADPRFNRLWRADKQYNSPFLVRHSLGLEIVQYVQAVEASIKELYLNKGRQPVLLPELVERMNQMELPISYANMGYPSFEVFLMDKRFEKQWQVEKKPDFTIDLKPILNGRDFFLDKTYSSVASYFKHNSNKPTTERLVQFFSRGIANKLYKKFGFQSLEELAEDPIFDSIRNDSPSIRNNELNTNTNNHAFVVNETAGSPDEQELANLINRSYTLLATEDEWVSLTAIASRISSVKQRVHKLQYPSLSKFVQARAKDLRWEYRYTDSIPPDFQIRWLDSPEELPEETYPDDYFTEEALINEVRNQVEQIGNGDWVLLAVIGQYIRNLKPRVEKLGYPSFGVFVKENARKAGWIYTYIDDVPAKLSIKIKGEPMFNDGFSNSDQNTEKTEHISKQPVLLLEPGFCLSLQTDNPTLLEKLASLAEPENWFSNNSDNGGYDILQYYLISTFVRCAAQSKIRKCSDNKYTYHTGLYSSNNEAIIAVVMKDTPEIGTSKLVLTEIKLDEEHHAPATYFDFSGNTQLETYICNPKYPVKMGVDMNNCTHSIEDFDELIANSMEYVKRQIRLATNCYDAENNEMHLLVPLYASTQSHTKPSAIAEIAWRNGYYEAVGCTSLSDAYKKARVVSPMNYFSFLN